jgi:hypothetical protein
MPTPIELCRYPAVLEKTSTRGSWLWAATGSETDARRRVSERRRFIAVEERRQQVSPTAAICNGVAGFDRGGDSRAMVFRLHFFWPNLTRRTHGDKKQRPHPRRWTETLRLNAFGSVAVACVIGGSALAQGSASAANPVGVWRGTSLCLVHPSACHDELVVYRITRVNASDSLAVDARKLVNGQEDEMGVLGCRVLASSSAVICRIHNGTWRFMIRGDSLVGELRLPDSTKFRDVRTARSR